MICRPSGQGWELVRQPDHGVLACALLDAITDAPRGPLEGFRLAVAHHDDGWTDRDREPRDGDGDGPDGDDADVERDGSRVRLPAEMLANGCDLVVPVLTVGGASPFPVVGESVRTISLVPVA